LHEIGELELGLMQPHKKQRRLDTPEFSTEFIAVMLFICVHVYEKTPMQWDQ